MTDVTWADWSRCHQCGVAAGSVCHDEHDEPRTVICKGRKRRIFKTVARNDIVALREANEALRKDLADRKEQVQRLAAQLAEARGKLDRIAAMATHEQRGAT